MRLNLSEKEESEKLPSLSEITSEKLEPLEINPHETGVFKGTITGTVVLQFNLTDWLLHVILLTRIEHLFAFLNESGGIIMAQEFDLSFLGLNGAIDAEVAQALLSGKNDITKIPTSACYLTDKKNGAVLYNQARRIMKIAWDQEMRLEGFKYFSGNYTEDHPPTLLKDTDAAVIAQFTEALAPDIKALFEAAAADAETDTVQQNPENGPKEDEYDDPLLDLLFENYFKTVFSGINEALEAKAEELGATTEDMPVEVSAAALDGWADNVISQELAIMIAGQKAKELFALSKNVPQETDFSTRPENRAREDAYRKMFHTRAKVTVVLFQDDIHDPDLRAAAMNQVSVEELAAGSAYLDAFLKTLDETDRKITELLMQKYTQQEIAEQMGVGQPMVNKHIKKIQKILLKFDPEIKKILPLFGKK